CDDSTDHFVLVVKRNKTETDGHGFPGTCDQRCGPVLNLAPVPHRQADGVLVRRNRSIGLQFQHPLKRLRYHIRWLPVGLVDYRGIDSTDIEGAADYENHLSN